MFWYRNNRHAQSEIPELEQGCQHARVAVVEYVLWLCSADSQRQSDQQVARHPVCATYSTSCVSISTELLANQLYSARVCEVE